jgi:dihydroorotate dehydrogenase (fumarate)
MVASVLLMYGPEHLAKILAGLRTWMDEHHYASVEQMRGRLTPRFTQRSAEFERANYINVLKSYDDQ